MSFRLADLKRSVRKGKEGYQVTPGRLEGRAAEFKIEFLLEQFEAHLGRPRRELDPAVLLDFVGDAREGRGLLATLSQWYRVRPRTLEEVLMPRYPRGEWKEAFAERGITDAVSLRAWLYAAVNHADPGFLVPERAPDFWAGEAETLAVRPDDLPSLLVLDQGDEAVLVRTGPAPTAADVAAAYNARAHTTLLRSATDVTLYCAAAPDMLAEAADAWVRPLGVEYTLDEGGLRLLGKADALGCWTRHGARVERAVLELIHLRELRVRELRGRVRVGERDCRFLWKGEVLGMLGGGQGASLTGPAEKVEALAAALRKERDRGTAGEWSVRRGAHLVGVEGGVFLPHLELRRGDARLYLRVEAGCPSADAWPPFQSKTPVATIQVDAANQPMALQFPGAEPQACATGAVLEVLGTHLDAAMTSAPRREPRRAPLLAA